ncbi:Predicted signal-transduction protein containing cAMP-binding and CBS domains [Chromobacterium violaceum]|uniref:Predicted signal-transduction protein containing cAMP-binding and CBS domains n=1 Tax=Chromobacterium violaceum TaxID=536 RepID=A0A447T983_CHRVL|nr:Predicted signal-transduction protein containing cAMP-binding and CBS domains [Chromobacterium violaceum]
MFVNVLSDSNPGWHRLLRSPVLPPSLPIREAASRMMAAACSSIVVRDEKGAVLGLWTESDALEASLGRRDPDLPVGQAVSAQLASLPHDMPLQDAVEAFRRRQLRHALVWKGGQPLGIVTLTDIVRNQGLESFLLVKRIRDLPGRRRARCRPRPGRARR